MARRRAEAASRIDQLAKVAGKFEKWLPATEVLVEVEAQPTIFPQLNRATRVGGWPNRRIAIVHGPSSEGKTLYSLGLGLSYLLGGNFFFHVDAEFTTPADWLAKLMGKQAKNPAFKALRPKSYEQTSEAVREIPKVFQEAKDAGELDESVSGLVVIDSLQKLVSERLLKKIEADEGGVDGADGRAAMMRAALNSQWMNELVPLAFHANLSIVLIVRESEKTKAHPWDEDFKLLGGKAIYFDSSLAVRVVRAGWVKDGTGADAEIIGERHHVRVRKTKVGEKDDKGSDCYFHTSNGRGGAPFGFDRARDVFEVAVELKIIERSGAWYSLDGERIGQGENTACAWLRTNPEKLEEVEKRCELGEGEVP